MNVKVLGDAPAMAMGNLFWTWAKYGGDVRTQEAEKDLFRNLMDLPKTDAPKTDGREDMFAAAPTESFDWSGGGGKQAGDHGERDGSHRAASHDAGDGAGLATVLTLFKSFGHGDLDI